LFEHKQQNVIFLNSSRYIGERAGTICCVWIDRFW